MLAGEGCEIGSASEPLVIINSGRARLLTPAVASPPSMGPASQAWSDVVWLCIYMYTYMCICHILFHSVVLTWRALRQASTERGRRFKTAGALMTNPVFLVVHSG